MRINVKQQEALEAKRKAAEKQDHENDEDEGMRVEENMNLGDESEEKITTFQEDLEIITDFKLFYGCQFKIKLMQGVNFKPMLGFGKHKNTSKERIQEDLKI